MAYGVNGLNEYTSVVAVSDASGNSLGVDSYSEYGIKNASNIGRFQYTGQIYLPEVGLNYYKARMHSARWGRFLQVDPIGYENDLNLHTYVRNYPLNHADPTGAIADTLVDVGFIAYDICEFATNPSWTNAGALGADVVGAVVPFATGLGAVVRGVGKGADAARGKGVVYERTNKADPTEKPHFGQAKSDERYLSKRSINHVLGV